MGEYINSGNLISHVEDKITLIAKAEDSEKAHFLAVAANAYSTDTAVTELEAFDYVAEAMLTLSNQYHGDMVAKFRLWRALDVSIAGLQELDLIKKTLFYGKDNGLAGYHGDASTQPTPGNCLSLPAAIMFNSGLKREEAENLIHGIIGLATEAGELLELLRNTLNGERLDRANLKEEIGDGKWYMAILAKVGGFMWGDDERVNIAKLRARFPNAFTEHDANNRNLAAEREILEADDNQLPLPMGSAPSEIAKARFEANNGK